jgi:hypothetical protein
MAAVSENYSKLHACAVVKSLQADGVRAMLIAGQ